MCIRVLPISPNWGFRIRPFVSDRIIPWTPWVSHTDFGLGLHCWDLTGPEATRSIPMEDPKTETLRWKAEKPQFWICAPICNAHPDI